ncbi:folt-2 [Pristionchus pacificus]|uniref:Folt-2 n=1 Tax=Pristionchus pacificus TaxID=54126 RepID=A0A2A6C037_PRIPA|nr:folt-2 [Pristionchus pacificus]|eukprot:PDM71545.1 folt-2 [Pristionchus pacificus]
MNRLLRILLVLAAYGFFKEFKPSEPYLYEFEHETLNISSEDLSSRVYPVWTYSYLIFLVPVFLLTDILLYKPIIVAEAVSYLVCWILFDLPIAKSVLTQQIIEVLYGAASATEVAYFAYIYVVVDRSFFKRATSISRAALQAGKFTSYLTAQLIILLHWGDYYTLNYIATGSLALGFIASLLLPMASWRVAYERRFPIKDGEMRKEEPSYGIFVKRLIMTLWKDTVSMYSNSFILKWSLWWALASCVDYQVQNYAQTLWGSVQTEDTQYNGITEAIVPLVAFPTVLLMEKVNVRWHLWGEATLAVLSIIDAGILLLSALTPSIFVMYGCYIVYRVLYEAMITIAQFNLASHLYKDSFGLLFGLNTFVALVLQTILTMVVADKKGLHLPIREQFYVYSGCHVVISVIFVGAAAFTLTRHCRNGDPLLREEEQTESSSVQEEIRVEEQEHF